MIAGKEGSLMRIAILLVALTFGMGVARAQDATEALQAANELAAIISADAVNQISRELTAGFWPNVENAVKSKVDDATLSELRADFDRRLTQFGTDALKDAPAFYAKYFTVAELREITAFYRTPTGAKALQTMPKVMFEYLAGVRPKVQEFQQGVGRGVQEIMQRHGYRN
jgi:hypothetical protein